MQFPADILHATRHDDPYAYYAHLAATQPPVFFDEAAQLWVAQGGAVTEALGHPALRVRPAAEPVPRALLGIAVGEVFALLVRMNDGAFHTEHRPAVERDAGRWTPATVGEASEAAMRDLLPRSDWNTLLTAVPVQAMARLLGVAEAERDATVQWVHDFTQGIAIGANAETIARADEAARALMAQGEREGLPPVRAANRIALMQQSLDATAGMLGLAMLGRNEPAVHHTRRFAADDLILAGQPLSSGSVLIVLLASAGLGFGQGSHACPGERIATAIVAGALRALAADGRAMPQPVGWRPLPNARIPVFPN